MFEIVYKTASDRVRSVQIDLEDKAPPPTRKTNQRERLVLVVLASLLASVEKTLNITIVNIHQSTKTS